MTLEQLNKQRWDLCKIPESNAEAFRKVSDRLKANKPRYDKVSKETGVPWWFIAVVHYRESNCNWNTQLAQGDPLNKKSTHVPKGRGPFSSWEEGAVDALVNCHPYAAKNKDWSIGSSLAMLEKYNGLGYFNKGLPSPYLWAGTNQYTRGKFIADGVFSPTTVDKQLGCAGILKFLGVGAASKEVAKTTGVMAAISAAAYSVYNWGYTHWEYILATALGLGIGTAIYSFVKFRKGKNAKKSVG